VYPELQKRQKEAAHGRMMKSVAMKAASQMAKAAGTVTRRSPKASFGMLMHTPAVECR
jgi:hypothetical protein